MKDIVDYEEFMSCLESLYTDTDYGIHATPATTHAFNLRAELERRLEEPLKASILDAFWDLKSTKKGLQEYSCKKLPIF